MMAQRANSASNRAGFIVQSDVIVDHQLVGSTVIGTVGVVAFLDARNSGDTVGNILDTKA